MILYFDLYFNVLIFFSNMTNPYYFGAVCVLLFIFISINFFRENAGWCHKLNRYLVNQDDVFLAAKLVVQSSFLVFFHFVPTLFVPYLNALIYISTYDEPGHSIGFRTPKLWQIIIQTFLPGNFIKHKPINSDEFKEIYI